MKPLEGYKLGFIGLGLMGRPMCRHLHDAGAQLTVHNRSRAAAEQMVQPGIVAAESPAEVASCTEILVLMVSDTPAVEAVLFGTNGVIEGLRSGSLVIDMGTTAAQATREFADRLKRAGADLVDAPVSGGQMGAQDASLSIMAGGEDAAIERARPLFEVLGKHLTHVGGVGAGQVAKAANQIIVGLNIGAVAEALALAECAGVDKAKVREALLGGFAASRVLEVHGRRMIEENFTPGAKVATQHKDLRQALELGASYDLSLPATRLNMNLYRILIEQGEGALDHSALFKLYQEKRTG
ncbi:MAG: NAD(P)-dependent oxidoreductase [Gammaproteobacteria bacterium]|nr:NAD(P)-dependent oxidoreductase [Gammaproteobacteria bacterium]